MAGITTNKLFLKKIVTIILWIIILKRRAKNIAEAVLKNNVHLDNVYFFNLYPCLIVLIIVRNMIPLILYNDQLLRYSNITIGEIVLFRLLFK